MLDRWANGQAILNKCIILGSRHHGRWDLPFWQYSGTNATFVCFVLFHLFSSVSFSVSNNRSEWPTDAFAKKRLTIALWKREQIRRRQKLKHQRSVNWALRTGTFFLNTHYLPETAEMLRIFFINHDTVTTPHCSPKRKLPSMHLFDIPCQVKVEKMCNAADEN